MLELFDERRDIGGRDDRTGEPVLDDVTHAPHIGRENRHAGGLGLEQHGGRALGKTGEHEDVGGMHPLDHVRRREGPQKRDVSVEAEFLDEGHGG